MYCGLCGTKMPDEENICPNCGADMSCPPPKDEPPCPDNDPGFLRRLLNKMSGR